MTDYNIGWDFTGCIGSPVKTSLKRLVEYKVGEESAQVWGKLLEKYGELCGQYGREHGEDVALLDFYQSLGSFGVSRDDFRQVSKLVLGEGLIRDRVIGAMAELRKQGARNVVVTKNLAEELEALAEEVNERSGLEVISGVVGVRGQYDAQGRLVGVEELIGDYEGELDSVSRVLKRDAVRREIGDRNLSGYVTDTGDKDIREMAGTSVIIRSSVPYEELDEYFQISADPRTGNYQLKVMNDGAWDVIVNDGKNLERDLVKVLGRE